MTGDLTSILAPFEEEEQALLIEVDNACAQQMVALQGAIRAAQLAGKEEYKISMEDLAWSKIIRAYGILMNRAIDAGWVQGIMTEDKT